MNLVALLLIFSLYMLEKKSNVLEIQVSVYFLHK